jgi:cytochrome c oxidase subunit 2
MDKIFSKFLSSNSICDSPEPWIINFQDPASPIIEGLTELHDTIFFYLILIGFGVIWIIISVIINFSKNPISYRYYNHGTIIELI